MALLKKEFKAHSAPIIELIEAQTHDPFCVLVGTILSARTKDQCTAARGSAGRLAPPLQGNAALPRASTNWDSRLPGGGLTGKGP